MTRCESVRLAPDPRRVITKPFLPREEGSPNGSTRIDAILRRILAMPERDVHETLRSARTLFAYRHRDLDAIFERGVGVIAPHLEALDAVPSTLTDERRGLIGAYFTHEYSIEAAALGNPSIIAAPDQSGLAAGAVRFVMSLRSIGEGHISSIEFRSGVITADATVQLDAPSDFAVTSPDSWTSAIITRAPASARALAIPSPSPWAPPVTSAVRSVRS